MIKRLFVPIFALLLFLQWAAAAQAADDIRITVSLSSSWEVSENHVPVTAWVESKYPVRSVKASIDSAEVDLRICSFEGPYCGEIPLQDIAYGEKTVTVKVEDVEGGTASAQTTYVHSPNPELQVIEPLEHSVVTDGRLYVRMKALSSSTNPVIYGGLEDDRGNGFGSFQGTDHVDQWINLPWSSGSSLSMYARLTDDTGMSTAYRSKLYVENNDRLQPLYSISEAGPYDIVAYDDTRVFALSNNKLFQILRSDGTKTEIPSSLIGDRWGGSYYLTPAGLLFSVNDPYDRNKTYFWNGTEVTELTHPIESDVQTQGSLALYATGDYGREWIWTNLENGEVRRYDQNQYAAAHLEKNGDLLLVQGDAIKRLKTDGTEEVLLTGQHGIVSLISDGSKIVFRKEWESLHLLEGGQVKTIAENSDYAYRAAGGWIAYSAPAGGGYKQVFLRSPQGENRQVSLYESDSYVRELLTDGQLALQNGADLYHVPAGAREPYRLTPYNVGEVQHISGKWYKGLGRTLFEIRTGERDREAPSWPSSEALTVSDVTYNSLLLQWQPASDNTGVGQYRIYQGEALIGSVAGSVYSYPVPGLQPASDYTFSIEAVDAAGNVSAAAPSVQVKTPEQTTGDTTAPQWPTQGDVLTVQDVTYSSLKLRWVPAIDDTGVTAYQIYRGSEQFDTVSGDVYAYAVTGLAPDTRYEFAVRAVDAAGNVGTGAAVSVMTSVYGPEPEAPGMSLQLKSGFLAKGSQAEVTVRADHAADLYAFLLKLQYDRSRLKLNGVTLHGEFGREKTDAVLAATGLQAETVGLTGSLLGSVPGKSGSVGLVTLKFTALQNGSTELRLLSSSLSDSQGNVRPSAQPLALTIEIGRGDVDGDGVIGLSDLVLVSHAFGAAKGEAGYDPAFDLNNDARIDLTDVQYIAGKVSAGA